MTRWLPSLHPKYDISEDGRLRTSVDLTCIKKGTISYGSATRQGYRVFYLSGAEGVRQSFRAHRLVLHAFKGPPPTPTHHAAHNDGNPLNNHISNLRWATPAENNQDKRKHGTYYQRTPRITLGARLAELEDRVTYLEEKLGVA